MEEKKSPDLRYSEAAQAKLDEIKEEFIRRIERRIKQRKYSPGTTHIEVTSFDIENIYKRFRYESSRSDKANTHYTFMYFVVGVLCICVGMFYNYFHSQFTSHDGGKILQSASMILGVLTITVSIIRYYYLNIKAKEAKAEKDKSKFRS